MNIDPLGDMFRCVICGSFFKIGTQYYLKNRMPVCKRCFDGTRHIKDIEKNVERFYK